MAYQSSSLPDFAAALRRAAGFRAATAENGGGGPLRAVVVRAAAAENGGGGPTSLEAERRIWMPPVLSMFSVLKYMVPSALALITLKYQGNPMNLFAENPIPAWCLLVSIWVFFPIVGALKANFPRQNRILFHVLVRACLVSGLVTILSSISIFIPRRYSFLPLVPVVPVAAVLAWPTLRSLYGWIAAHVNNTFDNIRVRVANWWGTQGQGSSLPV